MAEPVPLIFSCDTEDYETPASDDAELLWAQMFARHGIRACFCVVGEEARALRDRGRGDVLAALAQHEIASHSNLHSAHPTPAEYLEPLSFAEGVRRFSEQEAPAIRDLHDLLDQQPSAWCKPGNSWGPAVPSAAATLGMPVFCDAPLEWAPGQPLWFAGGPLRDAPAGAPTGALGGLLLKYHTSFDRYFQAPPAERQALMRADFEALLASRLEEAQRTRTNPDCIVMYTHPCRTVTAAFPSNFTAGKNPPRAEWQPAPLRPRHEVDALVGDFDAFLAWIANLRHAGRVALTGYRELYERYRQPMERTVPLHQVTELARALAVDQSPIRPRIVGGRWLSPTEQFGAFAWVINHVVARNQLPRQVPVKWLLGPTDAEQPIGVHANQRAATITVQEAQGLAGAAHERCVQSGAVPASIQGLGPGRLLRLMARLVVDAAGPARGTTFQVPKCGDETDLAQRDDVQRLHFRGSWSIFPPEFEGTQLVEQTRWQTWAAKPAWPMRS